ncbi:MAG: CinA family protein [Planctomycetaceae bacterium]|nr:CinA family protein [Planctomycetaceae bacterium]
MTNDERNQIVRRIHESPLRMGVAVTGGGSLAVGDLLAVPGASKTILEAVVPYSEAALADYLSREPEQCCSEQTARQLAMSAFLRAKKYVGTSETGSNLIGVGCTCSLASDRPKRGEHRVFWAVQTESQTFCAGVVFHKGARSRPEEERLAADLLLTTLAAFADDSMCPSAKPVGYWELLVWTQKLSRHPTFLATKAAASLPSDGRCCPTLMSKSILAADWQTLLLAGETPSVRSVVAPDRWQRLLFSRRLETLEAEHGSPIAQGRLREAAATAPTGCGSLEACVVLPNDMFADLAEDHQKSSVQELPEFLFSGSFDPMHQGHRCMMEIVRERTGDASKVAFEITVQNVDKPPLDYLDIRDRLTSIAETPGMSDVPVWLTRLPRFVDKSRFFRNATFVVGADTLKRIAAQKYYQANDKNKNDDFADPFDALAENGCRFLCFARENDGHIETAETLDLPPNLRTLVESVPPDRFCDSISSTALRRKGAF